MDGPSMDSEIDRAVKRFFLSDFYQRVILQRLQNELVMNNDNYRIKNIIKDEIHRLLPGKIKTECNSIVKPLVNEELELFARVHIPSHVNKSLSDQLGSYLNNHTQMTQILAEHSRNLNQALQLSAEHTLRRVVNEEEYHMVTNQHVEAMKQRFSNELKRQEVTFQTKLNDFQKEVSSEIKELHETKEKNEKLQKAINDLTLSNKNLKRSVFVIGIISIGGLFISATIKNRLPLSKDFFM